MDTVSKVKGQIIGPWKTPLKLLNVGTQPLSSGTRMDAQASNSLAKQLRLSMLKLKGLHISEDGMSVNYKAIRKSSEFAEYKKQAAELANVEVKALSPAARKTFFINLYNSLTVHAIVEGLFKPVLFSDTLGRLKLYAEAAYVVGGIAYSLNDIENGILRGNRKSAAPFTSLPFSPSDPRLDLCVDCDARIHFALNCGAKGCPPIAFYSEDNLNNELNAATESFMLSGGVSFSEMDSQLVILSKIFDWYKADFGGATSDADLVTWIKDNAPTDIKSKFKSDGGTQKVEFLAYDWALNS